MPAKGQRPGEPFDVLATLTPLAVDCACAAIPVGTPSYRRKRISRLGMKPNTEPPAAQGLNAAVSAWGLWLRSDAALPLRDKCPFS